MCLSPELGLEILTCSGSLGGPTHLHVTRVAPGPDLGRPEELRVHTLSEKGKQDPSQPDHSAPLTQEL